jgi:hypothetical protein
MLSETKRRLFQFHLSTMIIIAFAGGIFVYVNCTPRRVLAATRADGSELTVKIYGWPLCIDVVQETFEIDGNPISRAKLKSRDWQWTEILRLHEKVAILANAIFGIAGCIILAVTLELVTYRITRRRSC